MNEKRKRFRMGIVFAGSWGIGGGLHRALSHLVNLLSERGFEVYVLSFTRPDFDALERLHGLRSRPARAYSVSFYRVLRGFLRAPIMYSWMVLRSIALSKEVDFVIFLGPTFHPAKFIPYSRKKVLVYQVGPRWNGMRDILASEQSYPKKILRIIFDKSWPSVFGPSQKQYHLVHNTWAGRLAERDFHLHPNGVLSLPVADVGPVGPRRQNRVVHFGRFHPEKRHEVAVEVIERVVRTRPDVELYLIGMTNLPGYADATVRNLGKIIAERGLGSNVRIMKDLDYERVIEEIRSCKVIMSNELEPEAYNLTLIEGMACGCVPVIPEVERGAWDDILEYGKYGFGYKTIEEAAQEILSIVSLPESEFQKLAERSRERAMAFGEERFVNSLISIIRYIGTRETDQPGPMPKPPTRTEV